MRRVANSRRHLADLLRRRPLLDPTVAPSEDPEQLRRVDQLRAMLDLPDPPRYPPGSNRI